MALNSGLATLAELLHLLRLTAGRPLHALPCRRPRPFFRLYTRLALNAPLC